jgi:uncharacterized protein
MSEPFFQKEEIKNFLVNRSFFTKKAKNLEEYFDRFKCIQMDPIVYITKSHEISLWNRVEDFTKKKLDYELYGCRSLIEYWLQLYSLISVKDRKFLSARMQTQGSWQDEFYADHEKEVEMARSYIIAMGPTTANDLKHIPQTRSITEWTSSTSNKATLDYLWDRGEISVSHRNKNKKYYDLTERLLPEKFLGSVDNDSSLEYIVKSNFAYLGVVRPGITWKSGRSIKDSLYKKFDELVQKGVITKIQVEGVKTKYHLLTEDIPLIRQSGKKTEHEGLTIIPPFDPLITDRRILSDFFDYEYLFQFYWPPAKRTFNPYGMPILYRGNIVGEVGLGKENSHRRLYLTELESTDESPDFRRKLDEAIMGMERLVFEE